MLRRHLRRAAALFAAAALLITAAAASPAMGDEVHQSSVVLSDHTVLSKGVFWSSTYSDKRAENYIEYTPNSTVTPVVTYGSKVTSKTTLSAMAKTLEASGKRVVAGVNGDYFVVSNGVPLGLVVTDGIIRSGSSYHWAVGFNADGTAFVSIPKLTVSAQLGSRAVTLADINKARTDTGGIYLVTPDFNTNTGNTAAGVDVIFTPDAGSALTIGGTLTGTVDQVLESTGAVAIPAGKMILTVNLKSAADQVAALRALQPGDPVSVSVAAADPRWNNVRYAVGALYQLVSNGSVVSGLEAGAAPRTALGIKADGTVILYTMDGRQSGLSIGATMTQVAQRLIELGCTEAVCLDGGGSTTITAASPDADASKVLNSPSDGSERAVSTHIFLVSTAAPTGVLDHFYLSPYDSVVLAGTQVQLTPTAVDTAYLKMANPDGLSYQVTGGGGTVTSSGLFTAGTEAGTSKVTVSSGGAAGSADITTIKTPDSITVSQEDGGTATSLTLAPNQVVNLTAAATGGHMYLTSQDTCFTWNVTDGAGTVDKNGTLTAAARSGSGTLTVSAGGFSTTVAVTVKGTLKLAEDFENGVTAFGAAGGGIAVTAENNADRVRFGYGSASLAYDTTADGSAEVPFTLPLTKGYRQLSFWVYGDGSGNNLVLSTANEAKETAVTAATALNFTGWKQVSVTLPADAASLSSVGVIYGGGTAHKGTVWLDQVTSANEAIVDSAPPVVSAAVNGGTLSANLSDEVDGFPAKSGVSLTWDGGDMSFTYSESTGVLTAELPAADGKLHKLTLTAADKSGNLARKSIDVGTAPTASAFTDMSGHWAASAAEYLYQRGIVSGVAVTGGFAYQPDRAISRAEFAAILYRWLDGGETDFSGVALPFKDAGNIPNYALEAVKAMYSMGILKGSSNNGVLTFNAAGSITRAEAMTMIGRTQERGYAEPELIFDDTAKVPSWTLTYAKSLVAQGVISGYNNRLNPGSSITRGEIAKILYSII